MSGKTTGNPVIDNNNAASAAKHAIGHVLSRIRDDKEVRYRLGAGTESFGRLTEAYALLTGQKAADVQEQFIRGSSCMHAE